MSARGCLQKRRLENMWIHLPHAIHSYGISALLSTMLQFWQWNFDEQRSVQLNLPIDIHGMSYGAPVTLLGAGASGAVFRLEKLSQISSTTSELRSSAIALKVSWDGTGGLIRQECETLRQLAGVPHVPQCLDLLPYAFSSSRAMMATVPVVDDPVTSFDDLADPLQAVYQIIETSFEMLRREVYTVDVQWLLSKKESSVLFIDFTERTDAPTAFLSEIVAGIPSNMRHLARSTLQTIAKDRATDGVSISPMNVSFDEILDIFLSLLELE